MRRLRGSNHCECFRSSNRLQIFTSFQEVFRGIIDLLSDLCARIIRWHSRTVEIPIISLVFWPLVFVTAVIASSYLNGSILEVSLNPVLRTIIRPHYQEFGLSLRSICHSFWAVSKDAFPKNGRILQKALVFSVRACYLFLKGAFIALYKFLEEEQPYSPVNTVSLAPTESGVALGGGLKLLETLENGDAETVRGKGIVTDVSDVRGGDFLGKVAVPAQADSALDWAASVGFVRVEVDIGADYASGTGKLLGVGDCSNNLFDRAVTTDIQIYTAEFTGPTLSVQTLD